MFYFKKYKKTIKCDGSITVLQDGFAANRKANSPRRDNVAAALRPILFHVFLISRHFTKS